jgi:hypothetical protein
MSWFTILGKIMITYNIKMTNTKDFIHFEFFWKSHIIDLGLKNILSSKNHEYLVDS